MIASLERSGDVLEPPEVRAFIGTQLDALDLNGRSLCLVIPDATRSCPLPLLLSAIQEAVIARVSSCTVVIALGTHAPMSDESIRALVGTDSLEVVNHAWWENQTFVGVGTLSSGTVGELSGGRLDEAVEVRINRLVLESDVTIIVGPVLPHEVVGFSGGNKYLFPGLSGQELIDVTHWLGALLTSREIIGARGVTPVRALVDAAAGLVPGERHALCVVVDHATVGSALWPSVNPSPPGPPRPRCPPARTSSTSPIRCNGYFLSCRPLRRPVDRRQRVLQSRARRGRRRRGRSLRSAYHGDRSNASRPHRYRLPLPRLFPGQPGNGIGTTPGATWPTRPTSSGREHTTRCTASENGSE